MRPTPLIITAPQSADESDRLPPIGGYSRSENEKWQPKAAISNQLVNAPEPRTTATIRRVLDSYLKVDTRTDHNLAWLNELITRCAHTKHVGKSRVDACIISNILTDQLDPP